MIRSVGISGLEAGIISTIYYCQFESLGVSYQRALFQGQACIAPTEGEHVKALSNTEVRQALRFHTLQSIVQYRKI